MSKYDDDEGKGDAKSGRLFDSTASLILNLLLYLSGIARVFKDYSPLYLKFIQSNAGMYLKIYYFDSIFQVLWFFPLYF